MIRDLAIRNTHSTVRTVYNESKAFDVDNNPVALDEASIAEEITRLEAEQPWKELRQERNRRIAETDYTALSDSTLTDDMKTYRQELRDLPANTTDPANPVWPTKPEAQI